VEGTDLRKLLDQEGPLDPIRAVSIVSQAASALDTAHAQGLVHRDVKPGNILIAARPSGSGPLDHVYVSDFGLTVGAGPERRLTRSGQLMGSIDSIAPEQIQGHPVDGRADVYALGCVLYECLTGTPPFDGEVEAAILWAHVHEQPPRPTAHRPELPAEIDGIVARALAKRPEDRYPTCGELAAAARNGLGVAGVEVAPPPRRSSPWRRRAAAGGVAVALFALAAGAFALTRSGGGPASGPSSPASSTTIPAKPGVGFTGCEVTDSANVNDESFNQAVYEGLTQATGDLGISSSVRVSKSGRDYGPNIQASIDQGCSLIVTAGFVIAHATIAAAKANPDQRFATVDVVPDPPLPNVLGIDFRVDQAAFLAGYLAAGVTQSGAVAAFGGLDIPPVVGFMDGFAAGVLKYNQDHGTDVRLLGWDPALHDGTFVSDDPATAFTDPSSGRRIAKAFISEGADIILAVAGGSGLGAAAAARAAGDVLMIGVDTDQYLSAPEFGPLWLTSIRKRIDVVVETAMGQVVNGSFTGGTYRGTLENDGVDLAPYHNLSARVPQALRNRLQKLKAGIIDGSISVDPRDYLP
jgi:basic membrane protein A